MRHGRIHKVTDLRTGLPHATRDFEGRWISQRHGAENAFMLNVDLEERERGRFPFVSWRQMVWWTLDGKACYGPWVIDNPLIPQHRRGHHA